MSYNFVCDLGINEKLMSKYTDEYLELGIFDKDNKEPTKSIKLPKPSVEKLAHNLMEIGFFERLVKGSYTYFDIKDINNDSYQFGIHVFKSKEISEKTAYIIFEIEGWAKRKFNGKYCITRSRSDDKRQFSYFDYDYMITWASK